MDASRHAEIVDDLIVTLPRFANRASDRKSWTSAVVKTMRHLCEEKYLKSVEHEFCGTCRDGEKNYHEWLLDVVWYLNSAEEEAILLGLESEWLANVSAVRFDFAKLLAVKAPIKIMLFESGCDRVRGLLMDSLNEVCRKWHQHSPGDAIYAIDWRNGEPSTFRCLVDNNGVAPPFAPHR